MNTSEMQKCFVFLLFKEKVTYIVLDLQGFKRNFLLSLLIWFWISWDWLREMNVGGSCDAYSFLAFSNMTCHFEDTGISVFWLHYAAW